MKKFLFTFLFCTWVGCCGSPPTKAPLPESRVQKPTDLVGSLSYMSGTEIFELRLTNCAKFNQAVVRHPHFYEVRVFNGSGQKVTNMEHFLAQLRARNVMDYDWVVLRPGESVSFPLRAYWLPRQNGKIQVSGYSADCVEYNGTLSYASMPDFARKANARSAIFEGTPRIHLQ